MILLTSTTDKLQLVTGSAVTVDVHVSWVDYTTSAVTPGSKPYNISTATTTDIVLAPAASTYRNVKTVHIRNRHATTSVAVTVQHTDGTTVAELAKYTLLAGQELSYVEGSGFLLSGTPVAATKVLASGQSNNTVTPTAVTGLTVPVGIGTWKFQYLICYQSITATVGVRFSVNHTGTLSLFVANQTYVDASATAAGGAADQDVVSATVVGGLAARAKSTAGWGTTVSVDTINAEMLMIIDGLMTVTVAGNIELWHGSETAAETSVRAGSSLFLQQAL